MRHGVGGMLAAVGRRACGPAQVHYWEMLDFVLSHSALGFSTGFAFAGVADQRALNASRRKPGGSV